jgi:hypothetical protein
VSDIKRATGAEGEENLKKRVKKDEAHWIWIEIQVTIEPVQ